MIRLNRPAVNGSPASIMTLACEKHNSKTNSVCEVNSSYSYKKIPIEARLSRAVVVNDNAIVVEVFHDTSSSAQCVEIGGVSSYVPKKRKMACFLWIDIKVNNTRLSDNSFDILF